MPPRVILDVAPRGLLWRPNRRTCFGVGGSFLFTTVSLALSQFPPLLLLSGSWPDALKRAQLDHLCTHTLKGP
jgi:hypothetical protein